MDRVKPMKMAAQQLDGIGVSKPTSTPGKGSAPEKALQVKLMGQFKYGETLEADGNLEGALTFYASVIEGFSKEGLERPKLVARVQARIDAVSELLLKADLSPDADKHRPALHAMVGAPLSAADEKAKSETPEAQSFTAEELKAKVPETERRTTTVDGDVWSAVVNDDVHLATPAQLEDFAPVSTGFRHKEKAAMESTLEAYGAVSTKPKHQDSLGRGLRTCDDDNDAL